MNIQLSDHFTYRRIIRFTLPSIVMMIVTSIYSVIDGLFVANIVGSNALSAINIVTPLFFIVGAFGFMLGTGGSAEVARTLGEGQREKANKYFSMIIYSVLIIGIVLGILGFIFMRPLSLMLGASEAIIEHCVSYGRILIVGSGIFMLQTTFQSFFIVAEKPNMGLIFSLASGITNILLDYLFVYVMKMGISGAAIATVCGYIVGGIIPFIYFFMPSGKSLKITKTKLYPKILLNSCINGSSEMMSNVSQSIVTILYNLQLMKIAGENGVAAITVIMYVNFIFIAIFIGFSIGTAPIISYNYGAENHAELKNVYKKSITIIGIVSLVMAIMAVSVATPAARIFVGSNEKLTLMTSHGLRIFAISFLFSGVNIFGSSFFTALCNGKISAFISFLRTLVFQSIMIIVLPKIFGINGVWFSVVVAELISMVITTYFFISRRKQYHYMT